ncbi:MAG TPA: NAD(P)/FAD-dependent oxidoreductase [Flavobacteriales bacterium]|nr:NAD(P)/FAD-dependent oxidoreductase [Flavobacteriales bacterium]
MSYSKYKPEMSEDYYDAIFIGSGPGSLCAAAILAKENKKVIVLERHYVPGGFSHTFKRKNGFEWDVGVHYVGRVNSDEAMIRKTFDYVTDGKLKWDNMGEIYDVAIIDGVEYKFYDTLEAQIDNLIGHFPDEEDAIRRYFALVKKFDASVVMYFGDKALNYWLSGLIGWFLKRKFYKYSDRTTYDVLRELTSNETLIAVLCAQCGNYGLTPKFSSFAIHALIVDHYKFGGNYPRGGAASIYRDMIDVIVKNGGKVAIRAEVKEVIVENRRAKGVELVNGDKIMGKAVVSNAGAKNTFNKLLPKHAGIPEYIYQELKEISASTSHICLYVGLNKSDEELKLPKWNYWVYKGEDYEKGYQEYLEDPQNPPLAYISFSSAKDSEWPASHPGKSTIQVLGIASYDWFAKWEDSKWMKRGDDYEAFKEKLKEGLLQKLYEIVPQTKGHVEVCEISTPLSTKHFANYSRGEIYGLEHTPKRFRVNWLRTKTHIKKFYLTGQDVITVGVGGAFG